ncbi:hypothetical protein CXB51_026890 [Gossypium anomalum]|uniref:Integrase catalytic domain-containing protein n=1 Tax=Gossypium anomalum TaxID=47600 RepID=A0A8J6CSR0_9ROSI|nr:hypothetical protein CXB51_026890 [Gossypium anomalum]
MAELSKIGLLDGQGICKLNFCEHCVFGKQKRFRFTRGTHNTKGTLEYIHSDLWGPSRVPSRGGANYMLTFIDDFFRKMGKQIKYLRTDNGLEFCSDEFNRLCKSEGIMRHLTVRHTPQQNGVAERMNRTIIEKKKTPQEVWSGNPANYSDLKIFGCPAYAHVDNGKLEPRSIKYVFLGYKAGVKGYKLWCPENRKVVISRGVVFDETAMLPNLSLKDFSNKENQKQKYAKADLVAYALNVAEDIDANQEPSNYSEAVSCEDSEKWIFTMQEEMESLHKNRTWDLVKLPKGKKVVRCKWVFKKKEGTPGVEEPRYKARLVAKGYSQIPGVNFTDVLSPIVKHSSIRALLVAMHNLELEQLDVKTVFLHRELEEDIYIQQPEGFIVSEKEDYVCLLRKSLYSLKQTPRQCDGSFVYLFLYVDDMLKAAKDKGEIRKVKAQLSEEFEMKDLGPVKKILGMEILRDRKASKLYLSQKGYIEKVLCRFNMQSAKPVSTPLVAHFRLSSALSPQSDDEIEYMSHVPYSSAIGSLMYAMVCSRPDLSYAVSAFGRTKDGVIGYVDADFAGDLDRRRSLTGYVFTIRGCAISWKATLQITVALSTTEVKYMAITEACKEAIWLKGLFSELNEDLQISTIFCDSQSAIFLTKDQMFHERTKHINVRYHFVRDIIARGDIVLSKLRSICSDRDPIAKGLIWRIGSGEGLNISNDSWLSGPGNQAKRIFNIPLASSRSHDMLVWSHEANEVYSVKSGYRLWASLNITIAPAGITSNCEDRTMVKELWRPPNPGIIKLNFDASLQGDSKTSIAAVLARNNEGKIIGACTYPYEGVVYAFFAEADFSKHSTLKKSLCERTYHFVPREANRAAHNLALEGRRHQTSYFSVDEAPDLVEKVVDEDWTAWLQHR